MEAPTVVDVCGSLREMSYTRISLGHALDAAAEAGAETRLIDLRFWELPLFDPEHPECGDATKLQRIIGDADAVIVGTPIDNGMVSSVLVNAFEYLTDGEFEGTTVGLLATASGSSHGPPLDQLRTGIRTVRGWCLPHEVAICGPSNVFNNGEFVDHDLAARVYTLGRMATRYARTEPYSV